ncbi:tRNA (N(6)-L-threonylcarbamoyladenosine(37)-C(2))-methylthiotransferase [Candidatus Woesearchaeota archaeon]|nr:tRNA (N(6)-L-threonylcarbamoyladenosine(37)-C(2))-methylthiotransferase [Candidatus Woesearchaeota archaeon]
MTSIYFKTLGCSTSHAESEVMAGLLKKADFEIVDSIENAEIIILNVCIVKGTANAKKHIIELAEYAEENKKKLIIAGCMTKEAYNEFREIAPDASYINTDNILSIVEVVEETRHDNSVTLMTTQQEIKINKPRVRQNKVTAIIPICNSCTEQCSYCIVKSVKGKLFSYPMEEILEDAQKALNQGAKEIWITAQDTAAYGLDWYTQADRLKSNLEHIPLKSKLPELLQKLIRLEGRFMIRVGMLNPVNLKPIVDELVEVYKSHKIYKFLHIPVQSGSNPILEQMNRRYTVEEFEQIVKRFKKEFPEISISTDFIAGFPGETDAQFTESIFLARKLSPDVINISRYQDIPKTASYKIENKVHGNVSKQRTRLLTDIYHNITRLNNERWINWEGEVLINDKKQDFIGRNFAYKLVAIDPDSFHRKGNPDLLGEIVKVKIIKQDGFTLIGELL